MLDKVITKRKVVKAVPASNTFIYITRRTMVGALLKKVRKELIAKDEKKVTLCAMGAAIESTCSLALKIQDAIGGDTVCDLQVRTSTLEVIDNVQPNDPDEFDTIQERRTNKIEIDIVRKTGKKG